MIKLIEPIEKLGWKAVFSFVLLVLGFILATNQGIEDGLDLALPSDQKIVFGGTLVILGIFFALVAVLEAQKATSTNSGPNADLVARKDALADIEARINQHRALAEQDPEDFVSRLFLSAQRLREKLHQLHLDRSVHPAGRELALELSRAAAAFASDIEPIEIRSKVNLAKDDVMANQLEEADRQLYIRALGRWREKTWALLEGAALMLKTPA